MLAPMEEDPHQWVFKYPKRVLRIPKLLLLTLKVYLCVFDCQEIFKSPMSLVSGGGGGGVFI